MNLGQIRTAVRFRLADTLEKVWTDETINLFINEGVQELCFTEAMLKRYTFSLVDGTRAYSIPTDCLEIRSVKINGEKVFGTHAHMLEELDSQYLTATGNPYHYYLDDLMHIAFYPVPDWTSSYTSFATATVMIAGDLGEMTYMEVDGTASTFTAETGVILSAIDTSGAYEFLFDTDVGEIAALDSGPFICEISYAYQPEDLDEDADELSFLPLYAQDAVVWYAVSKCLSKEGQGQDLKAAQMWKTRFDEIHKEWKARNLEWSHGKDQLTSQQPVTFGNDLDYKIR
jgi:hypothetical protein